MSLKATVFNVSRASLHDGPGLRTVVYFKGCNLSCAWCHNPEGISPSSEVSFTASKCIGCGNCADICPACHKSDGFDRSACIACGRCVEGCTAKALEIIGKEYTAKALFEEIKKDEAYFKGVGGLTASGGECLLQADFLAELLQLCKANGINTLIESAFCVAGQSIEKVLKYTDIFYVDFKLFDTEKHRLYTGVGNELILKNIRLFAPKTQMVLRIPLIPDVNDDMEELKRSVLFAREAGARGVELLRYNPLGVSKYAPLGRAGLSFGDTAQDKDTLDACVRSLNEYLGCEDFVYCLI